ncbi:MAG: hypothetical protein PHQ36_04210 [Anaerolineales bacterium]|nr:hypothetical protein [Anaerolineales bacterium]
MATELAMAMRRIKAQESLVQQLAELNRKMDLVMAHLGIVDKQPAVEEALPVETVTEQKVDEPPVETVIEAGADEPPVETANQPKAKKK